MTPSNSSVAAFVVELPADRFVEDLFPSLAWTATVRLADPVISSRLVERVLRKGFEVLGAERGSVEAYLADKVPEFLMALLLDREIGFLATGSGGREVYLLPGQLPTDEPEVREYDVRAHMDEAQVRFRYSYDFLPAGVMSRFIVRTHPLSDEHFRWQRGTVLAWGGARALVLADRRRNPRMEVYLVGGTEAERLAKKYDTARSVVPPGTPSSVRSSRPTC